jgi:hypothetical protein
MVAIQELGSGLLETLKKRQWGITLQVYAGLY